MRERLFGFLDPGADAAGAGFQAAQAKIAVGSGGLFGVGLGEGVQKAFYLPEAHTDMIAAVIGEEAGLFGISILVGLYSIFGFAGFRTAQRARNRYEKLLAAGLTSLVLGQAAINLFAVMGMAPITGVPLPFVSYGNSSLLVMLAASGLILNVARRPGRPARVVPPFETGDAPAKLRVIKGGRTGSPTRTTRKRVSATSRNSRGRNSRPRRAGAGRRRRAAG
jgi:cell division protein FtsW